VVFFVGLFTAAGLHARRVRGSILWGILAAGLVAIALKLTLPMFGDAVTGARLVSNSSLMLRFQLADHVLAAPPSLAPTLFQMDLRGALTIAMAPYIGIFLFMVFFDTVGTLLGVAQQAGLMRDGRLPRSRQAFVSDATATVAGACLGTSTVTSYIESATGVEQGGRTGLTALTVAGLFLVALFFSPVIAMLGSYPPITSPALVLVGAMMLGNVRHLDWNDYTEVLPSFLVLVGIPLTYSIADGLALGLIAHPLMKVLAGRPREARPASWIIAGLLLVYFLVIRPAATG
jgi:AGZA family xanthine/uracil permease-like MFS transporter